MASDSVFAFFSCISSCFTSSLLAASAVLVVVTCSYSKSYSYYNEQRVYMMDGVNHDCIP